MYTGAAGGASGSGHGSDYAVNAGVITGSNVVAHKGGSIIANKIIDSNVHGLG
jgi:hypothetical protein